MNMRRPSAILVNISDVRKDFSPRNVLADVQFVQRSFGEMPIKGEELFVVICRMLQNNKGTVVLRKCIVCQDVNRSRERRTQRRSRFHKQIHAKMNRSPPICGVPARAKL